MHAIPPCTACVGSEAQRSRDGVHTDTEKGWGRRRRKELGRRNARLGLIVSLLSGPTRSRRGSRSQPGRHVKCVHACMRACMPCSRVRCMCTQRVETAASARCRTSARCTVYRSQRAAQGYHYGGSRHSLLIAGFQRCESRPNERSQLRSLAIIIFSAARKDAHTSERERDTRACTDTDARPGGRMGESSRISSCPLKYTLRFDTL